jgi:hypothetical protein
MTNITKLRGLLAEATPGNQLVLVHYMPALLDRLDKLEAEDTELRARLDKLEAVAEAGVEFYKENPYNTMKGYAVRDLLKTWETLECE